MQDDSSAFQGRAAVVQCRGTEATVGCSGADFSFKSPGVPLCCPSKGLCGTIPLPYDIRSLGNDLDEPSRKGKTAQPGWGLGISFISTGLWCRQSQTCEEVSPGSC